MSAEVQDEGIEISAGLQEQVLCRLSYGLYWGRHDINWVEQWKRKVCQLRIPLSYMRNAFIYKGVVDLQLVVPRAMNRASRSLGRRLSRQKESVPSGSDPTDSSR